MLINHISPLATAITGRSDLYNASGTRDASSISNSETAENPRTVPSVADNPTIRLAFGSNNDIGRPLTGMPNRRTNPAAFRKNSALWRSEGLATKTRLPGSLHARCTALAAVTVDFPHCRVQFKIPRLATESRTARCFSFGSNPSFSRANADTLVSLRASFDRPALFSGAVFRKVHHATRYKYHPARPVSLFPIPGSTHNFLRKFPRSNH